MPKKTIIIVAHARYSTIVVELQNQNFQWRRHAWFRTRQLNTVMSEQWGFLTCLPEKNKRWQSGLTWNFFSMSFFSSTIAVVRDVGMTTDLPVSIILTWTCMLSPETEYANRSRRHKRLAKLTLWHVSVNNNCETIGVKNHENEIKKTLRARAFITCWFNGSGFRRRTGCQSLRKTPTRTRVIRPLFVSVAKQNVQRRLPEHKWIAKQNVYGDGTEEQRTAKRPSSAAKRQTQYESARADDGLQTGMWSYRTRLH